MDDNDNAMIRDTRPGIGSLLPDGATSQASGTRLPGVSKPDEPPVVEQGQAGTLRWAPCTCGGVIAYFEGEAIENAVDRHQEEVRHLKWRIDRLEQELKDSLPRSIGQDREGRLYE